MRFCSAALAALSLLWGCGPTSCFAAGTRVEGDLWASKGLGIIGFDLTSDPGRWGLAEMTCDGTCNGDW